MRKLTRAAERLGVRGPAVQKVNAVSEEGRELLALGRFVELPEAQGFEAYEGLTLPKAPKPRVSGEEKEARAALREAERDLKRATAKVEAARRRLERLQQR